MTTTLVLSSALRGAIVLGVAAIITYAMRRKSAALRHLVWTSAIVCQLVAPLATTLVPSRDVEFSPPFAPSAAFVAAPSTVVRSPEAPLSSNAASPRRSGSLTALEVVWLLWVMGALLVGFRFVIGTVRVARDSRRASRDIPREWVILAGNIQEEMGLRRAITLRWGSSRAVPYTWGALAPVICLPAEASEWSFERMRMVLTHELAHVERFDAVTEVATQIAITLYWFNPLLWLAARRMRIEREHACDDRVLRRGVQPSAYVDELMAMMKTIGSGAPAPGFGAIAMARRSQFERRMLAVLDDRMMREPARRRQVIVASLATCASLIGVSSIHPVSAATVIATGTSSGTANDWEQSDFDDLVKDCRRHKQQVEYCDVRNVDVGLLSNKLSFRGGYLDGVIITTRETARTPSARMLVRTRGITEADARALASRVKASVEGGVIHSDGPDDGPASMWSTLYEITVPSGYEIHARTSLGQIGLRQFDGIADIAAKNGPLQVIGSSGRITGRTESGPILVGLGGARWSGGGLDLQSQNGPVYLSIPRAYSAHLVIGTTNGPLQLDYPMLVRRMESKRIEADVGAGGAIVRVTTLNGLADIR